MVPDLGWFDLQFFFLFFFFNFVMSMLRILNCHLSLDKHYEHYAVGYSLVMLGSGSRSSQPVRRSRRSQDKQPTPFNHSIPIQ